MIRVVIADDHSLIRDGIKVLTASDPDITIVGETGSLKDLIPLLDSEKPDILILDISFGNDAAGFEVLASIRAKNSPVYVIMLSMYEDIGCVENAMRAGARGYISKTEASDSILKALHSVYEGAFYLSPFIHELFFQQNSQLLNPLHLKVLTNREIEIFQLLGRGASTKDISAKLEIKFSTVGTHIENIKNKLGATGTGELMRLAFGAFLDFRERTEDD